MVQGFQVMCFAHPFWPRAEVCNSASSSLFLAALEHAVTRRRPKMDKEQHGAMKNTTCEGVCKVAKEKSCVHTLLAKSNTRLGVILPIRTHDSCQNYGQCTVKVKLG